ncbi:MAG: hypothetical protein ACREF0_16790 [Acetobacteraceae bacterium]
MSDLQENLLALDARLERVQRLAKAVVLAVGRARSTAKAGELADIPKVLAAIGQRLAEVGAQAEDLPAQWNFEAVSYLSDGRFLQDLKEAAGKSDLRIFERDGQIYCFPLLLRIEPGELGVKIGRKMERRINPDGLVQLLARAQKAPQRFREDQFLGLLYRAWRRLAGGGWSGTGSGPVMALSDIYETLTLFPGTEYLAEEFARDLLLLDRKPELRTRDGCRFELPASTLGKGKTRRIVAYDEGGSEHVYIGLRFHKERPA